MFHQDKEQFDRWLRDHADLVCQSQQHEHPAGPTAVAIMAVIAEDFTARPDGPGAAERLARIVAPYLLYLRAGCEVEDAREVALTVALWAGQNLAELMRHDGERIRAYTEARGR
ncbi:hypothetical protein [Streptomyces sp. NPDC001404]|uniref:hypothetical protein n=1 Tax=Streptomyces sp. NPDC001404 TaxID=3364571 RepID=UPI00368549D1